MASTLGARLRRLREAKKLTLQQVADAVGCTKAYIWELEMKEGQRPSAERIHLLAKVLGVTMEDLMNESNEQVPEATLEDVAFFRQYATMSDDEKNRVQDMMKLMFPGAAQEEPKR
jgi:transcriptional regulator with XRE-family HTH domain